MQLTDISEVSFEMAPQGMRENTFLSGSRRAPRTMVQRSGKKPSELDRNSTTQSVGSWPRTRLFGSLGSGSLLNRVPVCRVIHPTHRSLACSLSLPTHKDLISSPLQGPGSLCLAMTSPCYMYSPITMRP